MKYNPEKKELWKSKVVASKSYSRGNFITELDKISDIVLNGGQVEIKSQAVLGDGVQVMNVSIYFIPPKN